MLQLTNKRFLIYVFLLILLVTINNRNLKEINEQYKTTLVYVTHDQNEAMTFADNIIVMSEGEVVQTGSPKELFERPNTTFVGYFIGSPAMNLFESEA